MKYFKLFILLFLVNSCTQKETETTTYYLIRHAEKNRTDKTNKNPDLNEKGTERAKKWVKYFKNIDLDAIYSTDYKRTLQTAYPIAKDKKLKISPYKAENQYTPDFKKNTKNKTTLIVGHSNTIPKFANEILNIDSFKDIKDNENSKLFIISLKPAFIKKNTSVKIIHIN